MAKYRQIHIEFWQDAFVLDLTPEEKYFYLYLMTNSKTTQCGIYELPKRIAETETGYNRETIDKLLERFQTEYGKIIYHEPTKEVMVVNWIKFNWINSPKVKSLIKKELKNVKNPYFLKVFKEKCIEYGYGIDTLCIDLGEEREKEREEEGEEEREKEDKSSKKEEQLLQIKNLRQRYSATQLKIIDNYLEMIRHTRVSAKIGLSVILKMYQDWDKHPVINVEYGLRVHTENPAYHSKKENYTLGIIRNTTADEAYNKLQELSNPKQKKNGSIDWEAL